MPVHARRIGPVGRAWRGAAAIPRGPSLLVPSRSCCWDCRSVVLVLGQAQSRARPNRQAEESERAANQSAQHRLWDAYLTEVTARNRSRQVGQRFAALDTIEKAAALLDIVGRGEDRTRQLRDAVLSSVALPDMRVVRRLGERTKGAYAFDLSVAADRFLIAAQGGLLIGYRFSDGRRLWSVEDAPARFTPLISPDGRFAAATGDRGTKVWRVDGPRPQVAWQAAGCQNFAFAPDGRHAACSDAAAGMRLVSVASGQTVPRWAKGPPSRGSASMTRADESRCAEPTTCK